VHESGEGSCGFHPAGHGTAVSGGRGETCPYKDWSVTGHRAVCRGPVDRSTRTAPPPCH